MKQRLLWLFVPLVFLLGGCIAEGHRKLSIDIFGQNITVEDQVFPNQTGVQEFKAGFDDQSGVIQALIGWLFEQAEEPAPVEPAPD